MVFLYKGIYVTYDEDNDNRILMLIDNLPAREHECIISMQEHEGHLEITWRASEIHNKWNSGLRSMDSIDILIDGEYNDTWSLENRYIKY